MLFFETVQFVSNHEFPTLTLGSIVVFVYICGSTRWKDPGRG
jgi:hypothetical protein